MELSTLKIKGVYLSFLTSLYELCSFLYWNMLLRTVPAALAAFVFAALREKKRKIRAQHTLKTC